MAIDYNTKPRLPEKLTATAIAEALRQMDAANEQRYSRSDEGRAQLFSDVFQSKHRYCSTWKDYGYYDGKRWRKDAGSLEARKSMKMLGNGMIAYAGTAEGMSAREQREYLDFSRKMLNANVRLTALKDAQDCRYFEVEDLDTEETLFNCQNCVLDFSGDDVEVLKHSPDQLLSKIANVKFDPAAQCPTWEKFLHDIMQGDADKIRYLQQICGMALVADTRQEQLYILYGPSTRNGKSTFLETLGVLFGDYAANAQPDSFAQQRKDSRRASGDIARLAGVRLVTTGEPDRSMIFDSALIKSITGGDILTARHLNEREFEFRASFQLILNTNYLPRIADRTVFTSDRVKVIEFNRHFAESEQDKTLKRKLQTPSELSGILNWCIEGLRMYRAAGCILHTPDSIREATMDYEKKNDKIQLFVDDCLVKVDASVVLKENEILTGKATYEKFVEWCKASGFGVEGKRIFFEELRRKGLLQETAYVKCLISKEDGTTEQGGTHMKNILVGWQIAKDYGISDMPADFGETNSNKKQSKGTKIVNYRP